MSQQEPPSNSLDIFGAKAYGEAVKTATEGLVQGAGAFLSRICLPAAEEIGLLFKDRVNHWRALQSAKIVDKSKRMWETLPNHRNLHAHPRVVGSVIENGSWVDSDDVQEMWAGLLASSCSEDGKDESNLIFVNLLSQLTASQARVLAYSAEKADKRINRSGLATITEDVFVSLDELVSITQVTDISRIDRELDHLRALGLLRIDGGIFGDDEEVGAPPDAIANLTASDLGLQMYVRCQGSRLPPTEFFNLSDEKARAVPEGQS